METEMLLGFVTVTLHLVGWTIIAMVRSETGSKRANLGDQILVAALIGLGFTTVFAAGLRLNVAVISGFLSTFLLLASLCRSQLTVASDDAYACLYAD